MIISLNRVNQLIFVMVKCRVLFEVRTEFLNNIYRLDALRLQGFKVRNVCPSCLERLFLCCDLLKFRACRVQRLLNSSLTTEEDP
jgi:hypothetical protein